MSTPRVLLVRTLRAQQNRSMDRYADGLRDALRQLSDLEVVDPPLAAPRWDQLPLASEIAYRYQRFLGYRRRLRHARADLYHIIDHSYADLASVLPPERTIVTCHDLILLRGEHESLGFRARWPTVQLFRRRVSHLCRVAHVVCISQQTRDDLIELVGVDPERTSVIPNGVGSQFTPLPEERRRTLRKALAPADHALIFHVSTGAYKNVEGTLRTLATLRRGGTAALLVRAGRLLSNEQAKLARALGVDEAVRDLGRVSDERLVELYNLADVLLFPSHVEGFGWPPLEAMACGTPVVTSEAGALLEVTGDAALHAPANDPLALAAAVRSILDDGALAARLSAAGLERAGRYQWSETAAAFAARYRLILEQASAAGS